MDDQTQSTARPGRRVSSGPGHVHRPLGWRGGLPPALRVGLGAAALIGCAHREIADPRVFAAEYHAAVERGDVDAVHGMLVKRDRERLDVDGVREWLAVGGKELRSSARAVANRSAFIRVEAEYATPSGVPVTVVEERGTYRVGGAGALPARALSPRQALLLLRDALERRDYPALLRVLSSSSAATLDEELGSIVEGLDDVDRLDVQADESEAKVVVPGGHRVRLRRDGEVWKVEDFE